MKFKFLQLKGKTIKSKSGNVKWKLNQWQHFSGELEMCNAGFHCSKTPYQAFSFVQGEVLAIVETKGKSIIEDDKECWSDMKIVKAYRWTKKDSVAFAIYAAELVIKNYEKEYPNDKRPREAIKAAKKVLFHDTKKNRSAAYAAANAANAAAYAANAAYAAANAAYAAANAAYAAANAANAAYAAYAAKLGLWMCRRIKKLKKI